MSSKGEDLRHPVNGSIEPTWTGFSWPGFFFGGIWLLVKGLFGPFVVSIVLVIVTAGFAAPFVWLACGIMGNDEHRKSLVKKGYLTAAQWDAQQASTAAPIRPSASPAAAPRDVASQLSQLADLRDRGVLTDAEFQSQKAKLIAAS